MHRAPTASSRRLARPARRCEGTVQILCTPSKVGTGVGLRGQRWARVSTRGGEADWRVGKAYEQKIAPMSSSPSNLRSGADGLRAATGGESTLEADVVCSAEGAGTTL